MGSLIQSVVMNLNATRVARWCSRAVSSKIWWEI